MLSVYWWHASVMGRLSYLWSTGCEFDSQPCSTRYQFSTWTGGRLWVGEPSWYVTSHPGQLNLAIHLWVTENEYLLICYGYGRNGMLTYW